jgi:NTE family protein
MNRTALVISGGGSKGAFAVGVLRNLFERGVAFDLAAGTSTGALIAPLVMAQGRAAMDFLTREYTSVRDADILAEHRPQERIFRAPSFYLTDPLARRIGAGITQQIADTLIGPPGRQCFLSTVDLVQGDLVYFQTGPRVTPSRGRTVPIGNRTDLMKAMLASASIPVVMPPVPFNGVPFLDGGVREYLPLEVVIDAGATEIYAVILAPDRTVKGPKPGSYDTIPKVAMRSLDLLMEEAGDDDLRIGQLYVDFARHRQQLRDRLVARGVSVATVDAALQDLVGQDPLGRRRAVKLHIIRPQRILAGETASFDPVAMRANLDHGYASARDFLRTTTVYA